MTPKSRSEDLTDGIGEVFSAKKKGFDMWVTLEDWGCEGLLRYGLDDVCGQGPSGL